MNIQTAIRKNLLHRRQGSTVVEAVMALAISGSCIGAVLGGFFVSIERTEWSAYSLAAQALAQQRIEQTRAAKWDPMTSPAIDQVVSTNFPVVITALDLPASGTNIVYATNKTTITTISTDPPVKQIRVECSWAFPKRGVFTNTTVTYRSPDQ